MTDYTGPGGYYERDAEDLRKAKEEKQRKADELKRINQETPEWKEWDHWRKAFCSSQVGGMTVRQLLMGMDKLKKEPWMGKIPTDPE